MISTISVYDNPADNAYGRNRLYLENYLRNNHDNVSIVRLPSLFGNRLKKNLLYDIMHEDYDYLPNINSTFQYYCLDHIWSDIKIVLDNKLEVVNFSTEPIRLSDMFELLSLSPLSGSSLVVEQNMMTDHAHLWERDSKYLYNKEEVLNNLRKFINKKVFQ